MNNNNIFETATRNKFRFAYKGSISTEDLWDLSIKELDELYKQLKSVSKQAKEEGLLLAKTSLEREIDTKLDIVKYVFEVNPRNTSKMCSNCYEINSDLTLDVREWECERCHAKHDRDINAAHNVLRLGQELPEYKALLAA